MDSLLVSEIAGQAHRVLNPPASHLPGEDSITDVFRQRVAEFGDRTAVIHGRRRLDYEALDRSSDAIAVRLTDAGVRPGQFVGVCVRRSPELVAGLLGVLKCGAAYVPFNRTWPDERLRDVLSQAECGVVLTDHADLASRVSPARTVSVGPQGPAPRAGGAVGRVPPPPAGSSADAIAYVNFTSGSQGRPKGVLIDHRAVLRLVSRAAYAQLNETRRVLHMAPVTFDAATFEIWGPLLNGGACVLYPSAFLRFSELERVIAENEVTTVFLTTQLFNSVVDEAPQALDTVEDILTGGEHHSLKHIHRGLQRYGPGRITHVYGPTESTTFATFQTVCSLPSDGGPLPIGRPIQNTRAYVSDGSRLCEPGETGELLLAGHGLSAGYLGMPDLTAERFIPREIGGVIERLYRTGDLVRIDDTGTLVFEGRSDGQVKINGFRIEPGEVSHRLNKNPDVRQNFVCAHDGPVGKTLLAFVVPANGRCTITSVRAHLAAALPSYMLPAEIHLCEKLPLSPTGKVDRETLIRHRATRRERYTHDLEQPGE